MQAKNSQAHILVPIAILLTQFVNPSFLAANGKVGTLYVVVFATLMGGGWFVGGRRFIYFSAAHSWAIVAWLLVVAGVFFAFSSSWAILWAGIAGIYLLVFILATNFSRSWEKFADIFVAALTVCGLLAALLGLYEYIHFHTFGPTAYPLIPYLLPLDRESRIAGIYGQPNLFALFLTVTLLAYLYRYLHGSTSAWCRPSWLMTLRFLPVVLVAAIFFLTRSKGGFLSLFLILCFVLWLVVSKRYLREDRFARKEFFLFLTSVVIAFFLSRLVLISGIEEIVATRSFADTGINPSGRFVFWTSAILIFLDHPWLGAGLDNYRFLMNGYGPASHELLGFVEFEAMKSSFWAHNEYLQLLAEGGVLLFGMVLFLLCIFFKKVWQNFIMSACIERPFFLYSHLFLLPFLIQSHFEWPLRHPALFLLFVTFAAILTAQYPLKSVSLSPLARILLVAMFIGGLIVSGFLYLQERDIVRFQKNFATQPLETTLDDFADLAGKPYSAYRVLRNCLPYYTNAALVYGDDSFAQTIIPYSEELVRLEGAGGQWYDLSRLYLRVDRLEDARSAIAEAFELKPTNPLIFDFLHYLNIIRASLETGRPIEEFLPRDVKPVHLNPLERKHD